MDVCLGVGRAPASPLLIRVRVRRRGVRLWFGSRRGRTSLRLPSARRQDREETVPARIVQFLFQRRLGRQRLPVVRKIRHVRRCVLRRRAGDHEYFRGGPGWRLQRPAVLASSASAAWTGAAARRSRAFRQTHAEPSCEEGITQGRCGPVFRLCVDGLRDVADVPESAWLPAVVGGGVCAGGRSTLRRAGGCVPRFCVCGLCRCRTPGPGRGIVLAVRVFGPYLDVGGGLVVCGWGWGCVPLAKNRITGIFLLVRMGVRFWRRQLACGGRELFR